MRLRAPRHLLRLEITRWVLALALSSPIALLATAATAHPRLASPVPWLELQPTALQVPVEGVIQGRITIAYMAESGVQPVVAALVELLPTTGEEVLRTIITGTDGSYRMTGIAPGAYRLRVRQLSYETQTLEIELAPGQVHHLDISLTFVPIILDRILVESAVNTRRERARFEADAGTTARVVTSTELKLLPGLAEADVLRAVEVLPGVISTSDFSSAFNVRGGSADQNLILLDGFPIFNPFHLGGLFSVFNSDVLARAELLAGGFGAEHGGRVSSVLNVESRDYKGEAFGGEAGVSLLATRLSLHGSLPAPGTLEGGWFLSARRSYFDKILPADAGLPYHLTDLQAGMTLGLPGDGMIRFTAYTGQDVLDMSDYEPKRRTEDGEEDEGLGQIRMKWDWGNDVVGLRWDQPWGAWVSTARVGYSHFDEGFGMIDLAGPTYQSRVRQLFLRGELAGDLSTGLSLRFGAEGNRLLSRTLITLGGSTFWDQRDRGTLGGAFAQFGWRPGERWLLESGVRLDAWSAGDGTSTALPAPRLAVKRFLGDEREAAVKLALGRYTQFLHSLRDESMPFGSDTWVLAGRRIPAVISDQAQLGVEMYWGEEWSASAESYYRHFKGLVALNLADDLNDPDDDFLTGTGHSYGLDLLVRRSAGRLTGWTTVSLLRAERTFADHLAGEWVGAAPTITYPPGFDRRVNLDLVLQFVLGPAFDLGLRFNYGSGLPYTRPVAQHIWWEYDPVTGRYRIPSPTGDEEPDSPPLQVVLGPRNGARYPAYHRLDLSLTHSMRWRGVGAKTYLQVLNVYNRKNPLFYFYNYDKSPATMSGISMFPILPTIGVEVSF